MEISTWRQLAEVDWLVVEDEEHLHAFGRSEDPAATEVDWGGPGVTVCGLTGWLSIPGLFTRMGETRCSACCEATGMPVGVGSPKNDATCEAVWRARVPAIDDVG